MVSTASAARATMASSSARSALVGRRKHVVRAGRCRRRLADADAHADEVIRMQMRLDRLQAVVPGEPATDLDPERSDR